MDKRGCIIAYPVEGHKENTLKSAIRLGANRVILMDESESYMELFNRLGLTTDIRPILTDDTSLVAGSVANLISDVKNEYDDVSVLLLPSDPVIMAGMYIAACMEKVKVIAPVSDLEMKCLTLPIFPFANLNKNEMFVLTKITENEKITTRNLFESIKKEENYDLFCSRESMTIKTKETVKERSVLRHLQRILSKLEEMELISKEKKGKYFIWQATRFGKLIFGQGYREKY